MVVLSLQIKARTRQQIQYWESVQPIFDALIQDLLDQRPDAVAPFISAWASDEKNISGSVAVVASDEEAENEGPCAHLLGSVIDLDYTGYPDEDGVFRVKVCSYDPETGWYIVDSTGLSRDAGEEFTDEVDLGKMESDGRVTNIGPPKAAETSTDKLCQPEVAKRARPELAPAKRRAKNRKSGAEVALEDQLALAEEVNKNVLKHFRRGDWFCRLPRVDPSAQKPPNNGSKRPVDIHALTWVRCRPEAKQRELECRAAEQRGEGPPTFSEAVMTTLPEECRTQILEAIQRAEHLSETENVEEEKEKKRQAAEDVDYEQLAKKFKTPEGIPYVSAKGSYSPKVSPHPVAIIENNAREKQAKLLKARIRTTGARQRVEENL